MFKNSAVGKSSQYNQENVDAHCKGEWEKLNQQMFNYCNRTENTAYADLQHLIKKHNDLVWTGDVLIRIWEQWTKRGLIQYSVVKHGMEMVFEAYLDIMYERKQPSFNDPKMSTCFDQWKNHENPLTMTKHCYEN